MGWLSQGAVEHRAEAAGIGLHIHIGRRAEDRCLLGAKRTSLLSQ